MTADAPIEVTRHRFTVDEYERIGQVGVFGEDDRVELLDGEIFRRTPIGPVHASIVDRLNRLLVQRLGDRAIVRVQNPVRLAPYSEPQPDLALVSFRRDFYQSHHPAPEDVLLVVEVADSSLALDRGVKVPLYARARIPQVWLIDLVAQRVLVHRDPGDGAYYGQVVSTGPGDTLQVPEFDDVTLSVTEVLGAA